VLVRCPSAPFLSLAVSGRRWELRVEVRAEPLAVPASMACRLCATLALACAVGQIQGVRALALACAVGQIERVRVMTRLPGTAGRQVTESSLFHVLSVHQPCVPGAGPKSSDGVVHVADLRGVGDS